MQEIVDFSKCGLRGECGNGISEEEAIFYLEFSPQGDSLCSLYLSS